MREAVPEFVIVKLCDFVWPSITLPKLKLAGLIVKPACTPVPLTGIVNVGVLPLFVTVKFPLAAPAAVGANVTDKVAVADGFTVAGAVTPVTAKPVPETETALICTAPVPVFVKVICCTELLPVPTLPKLKLL